MVASWVWLTSHPWKCLILTLCGQDLGSVRSLELLCLYPYCILRLETVQRVYFTDWETEAHSQAVTCPRSPSKTMAEQELAGLSFWFPDFVFHFASLHKSMLSSLTIPLRQILRSGITGLKSMNLFKYSQKSTLLEGGMSPVACDSVHLTITQPAQQFF